MGWSTKSLVTSPLESLRPVVVVARVAGNMPGSSSSQSAGSGGGGTAAPPTTTSTSVVRAVLILIPGNSPQQSTKVLSSPQQSSVVLSSPQQQSSAVVAALGVVVRTWDGADDNI